MMSSLPVTVGNDHNEPVLPLTERVHGQADDLAPGLVELLQQNVLGRSEEIQQLGRLICHLGLAVGDFPQRAHRLVDHTDQSGLKYRQFMKQK